MQRHWSLTLTSVAAAAAALLLAAGCGGGGAAGVASVHSSTAPATVTESEALSFARCMRSHGLTGWPDPNSSGVFDKSTLEQLGYSAGRVRSVEEGFCSHLLPYGGQPPRTAQQKRAQVAAALAFARCMRGRGFPSFPDPTSSGQLSGEMVTAAGIDLHQPGLLHAGLACVPVTHGLLTRAAIERAVHGG